MLRESFSCHAHLLLPMCSCKKTTQKTFRATGNEIKKKDFVTTEMALGVTAEETI